MKKRIAIIVLVAIMLFTFAACGEAETTYKRAGTGIDSFGNQMRKVATFTIGGSKPFYFGFLEDGLIYLYTYSLNSSPDISQSGTYGKYLTGKGSGAPGYTCDSQFDGNWFANIYNLLLTFKAQLPIEIYNALENITKYDYYAYSNGTDHLVMFRKENLVIVIPSVNAFTKLAKNNQNIE